MSITFDSELEKAFAKFSFLGGEHLELDLSEQIVSTVLTCISLFLPFTFFYFLPFFISYK
jgi:hypothetical protein